jgi:hypothetical protein
MGGLKPGRALLKGGWVAEYTPEAGMERREGSAGNKLMVFAEKHGAQGKRALPQNSGVY